MDSASAETEHTTYCRNCPAACGLVLSVQDNRILSIRGDRLHPLTAGYLCSKGLMSAGWHNGEDRLTVALGRGESGELAPVPLREALDEAAGRLQAVLEQYGPRAVALYHGTGAKMNVLTPMAIKAWLEGIGSPYLYSSSTIDQSAKWVAAGRMGVFRTGKPVLPNVDTMLVVGSNPPVSHVGLPSKPFPANNPQKAIREARQHGAKLIVVDPRRTELARNADLHLQVFPGEDPTLLAAMINVVLQEGWEDRAFCERYVASVETLRSAVAPFTLAYAEHRARVPSEQIYEAARLFATVARKSASSGTGLDMSPRSNLGEHLLEALNAICGAYLRSGDVVTNVGGWRPRSAISEGVTPPRRIWQEPPFLWTEASGVVGGGEYPTSRLPDEILSGGIRALVVVGGNPAVALGQPEKTLTAFEQLEVLITLDPRLTETGRLSTFVFPTTLPYERYDATHFLDAFFPQPFVQIARPVLKAPPELLDDWEVLWEVARRLGASLTLREHVFGANATGGDGLALDMDTRPTSETLLRWLLRRGPDFEDIVSEPRGRLMDSPGVVISPPGPDDGARLDVCPPDVADELAAARSSEPPIEYAYRLVSRRIVETMNSAFRDAARTVDRWPTNPAFMNAQDMDELGIAEGDEVEIAGRAGVLRAVAEADPTLWRGVVSMAALFGGGRPEGRGRGTFTGELVSLDHDLEAINFMPMQSGIPVNVRLSSERSYRANK